MSKLLTITLPLVGAAAAVIAKLVTKNEQTEYDFNRLRHQHDALKSNYAVTVQRYLTSKLKQEKLESLTTDLYSEIQELKNTVQTLRDEAEKSKTEQETVKESPAPKPRAPRTPKPKPAPADKVEEKAAPKPRAPRRKTTPATEPAATAAVEAQSQAE